MTDPLERDPVLKWCRDNWPFLAIMVGGAVLALLFRLIG